ncbi:MAG: hypothetical protein QOK05_3098, partial [Chloroflexota bacterium]|nr:hypothetical protein [Chloroflexota bacterium]
MPEQANVLVRNVTRVEPGKPLQEVHVLVQKGRLVAVEPVNWGG